MENNKIEEVEKKIAEEIVNITKDKNKIERRELLSLVKERIKKEGYLKEDWQIDYAVKRVKDMIDSQNFNLIPATRLKRFSNLVLDYIGLYVFALIIGYMLGMTGLYAMLELESINELLLGIFISVLYYMIFEFFWSKTPAKFITRTKVVTRCGEKPNFKTILTRTLVRFVPFEAFSFLSEERPVGWHDKWSNTVVIDERKEIKKVINTKLVCCDKCGRKLDNDSKFCSGCGHKINIDIKRIHGREN